MVVFRLVDRTYGIDLGTVREILRPRSASRLPGSPPAIVGLINVRGAIITVIDLGVALGLRAAAVPGAVVLVEHGPKLVGVSVDEVLDVQRRADDLLDAAPSEVAAGGAVRAIGLHEGGVIVVLDIHDLLSHVLA